MSPEDQRLAALLRETDPPARDPAFRLAVLERQARQDMRARLTMVFGLGVAATGLLVAAGPMLSSMVAVLMPSGVTAAAAVLAVLATFVGVIEMRRPV